MYMDMDFVIIHQIGAEDVVPDTLSRAVPIIEAIESKVPVDQWYVRRDL